MGGGDGRESDSSDGERRHHHHRHREHRQQQQQRHQDDYEKKRRGRDDSFTYDDDWVYGTFDCFEDPKTCLCGCFCTPCQVRSSASKLGEPSCLYWLMYCCVPCIALSLLRNKVRQKYGIEGDTCEDAVLSWACTPCTNTQVANEINYREA